MRKIFTPKFEQNGNFSASSVPSKKIYEFPIMNMFYLSKVDANAGNQSSVSGLPSSNSFLDPNPVMPKTESWLSLTTPAAQMGPTQTSMTVAPPTQPSAIPISTSKFDSLFEKIPKKCQFNPQSQLIFDTIWLLL